jgi:hypothetical protein
MARRITTGTVGSNVLGALTTIDNNLKSVIANANVKLTPNGSGIVESTTHLQVSSGSSLRLADSDSSAYVGFRSPGTLGASYELTFPANDGDANQALITNGSGTLTWAAPAISVTNQVADASTYYLTLTTSTSGAVSTISTSNTKLSFVPSTGVLSSSELRVTSSTASSSTSTGALVVTGGLGVGGTITATSIVETSSIAYKENINPIENALDKILQLVGVTYDRKDGSSKNEAGLIKEEVEKVIPNIVTGDGINYTKLTAYLIESVKSLKQEINEIKGG